MCLGRWISFFEIIVLRKEFNFFRWTSSSNNAMQLIPLSHLQEIYLCGVINLTHKIVGWLFFKIILLEIYYAINL